MNFVSLVRSASAKWRQTALTVALLLLAGCGREEIRVYTAPKDNSATATAITVRPRPIARPKLEWQLPAGWTDTGPGKMNIASFVIAGATGQEAQVTITPLMLVAGREVMIVNMMREQVGLEAMSEEEAQKQFQPVEVGGEKGSLFELSGTPEGSPPKRIVTAIVHRSDSSLFYKLAGDTALVEAQKPGFLEFLKSIRIQSDPSSAEPDSTAPPPGASAKFSWQVPAQWKKLAAGEMQVARFAIPERSGAKAEVFVSVFGSDTGGILANVNRWRREIGLRDVDDAALPQMLAALDPAQPEARLIDFTNNNRRLVAAIVPREGFFWFYKLRGDSAAVSPEKEAFLAFVKSKP